MATQGNTRVILLCSSSFAFPAMQELVFFQQLAVVAVQRNRRDIVENIQALLKDTGVPVVELDKKSFAEDLCQAIKEYNVTLGLIMGFGYLLPAAVYNLPAKGFFNIHPGPLPAYRGVDPIFWQIVNREQQAGVSIHKPDDGFDTGPLVLTQMIKILPSDTYGILSAKLGVLAAAMVRTLLKLVVYDLKIPSKPQPESTVYYARQTAKEVIINWQEMDADTINALVNACNPWNKGAVTNLNNKIIRILQAEQIDIKETQNGNITNGTILSIVERGIIVSLMNSRQLLIKYIHTDEGFLQASRITELGFTVGCRFLSM